jgi:tRNA nucleotidyltransferase (CCA-adding enzyme)
MNNVHLAGIEVLNRLEAAGHTAVFVGGFVRDFLLGSPSADIDIATSATPSQVKAVFEKTKDTGVRYGTVTVFLHEFHFEVTTFRTEGSYLDARHPEDVAYATRLEDDLSRRDFTINAIAMDKAGTIHDLVGGTADLTKRTIRAIGNPQARFEEDALRMLRAFRFVSKLGFAIEPSTKQAIEMLRGRLRILPNERILDEIKALLKGPHPGLALQEMHACRIDDVFPEWSEGIRVFGAMSTSHPEPETFFAVSFLQSGGIIPDHWRFSNREKTRILRLMDLIQVTRQDDFTPMLLYCYGRDMCLQADLANVALFGTLSRAETIRTLDETLPIRRTCDLAFKGDDILKLTGVKNARIIGQVIEEMIDAVLCGTIPNQKEPLSRYALQRIETLCSDEETV